jgi:O-antigen ligase
MIIIIISRRKLYKIWGLEYLFILFFLYLAISILWSNNLMLSIRLIILEVVLLIMFFHLKNYIIDNYDINSFEINIIKFGYFYIISSFIFYLLGLITYYFHIFRLENGFYLGVIFENFMPRLRGFTESPNTYILYANIFLIYFLNKNKYVISIFTLVTILLSFSTTGIIISIFIILFNIRLKKRFIITVVLSLLAGIVIYNIYIKENTQIMKMIEWRLERNKTGTNRFLLWKYTIELIKNKPLLGYGINQSRDLISQYFKLNSVHNSFLEILLTGGLIGFLIYILLLMLYLFYSLILFKYTKIPFLFLVIYSIGSMANNLLHSVLLIIMINVLYFYKYKILQGYKV